MPQEVASHVVELIKQYDDKESKVLEIINETKSMQKALERYNRY